MFHRQVPPKKSQLHRVSIRDLGQVTEVTGLPADTSWRPMLFFRSCGLRAIRRVQLGELPWPITPFPLPRQLRLTHPSRRRLPPSPLPTFTLVRNSAPPNAICRRWELS